MKKHARSLVRVIEDNFGREVNLHGVEVGVWKGELSSDLLSHFPNLQLIMVDLWRAEDDRGSMHAKDSSQEAMDDAWHSAAFNAQKFVGRTEMHKGSSVDVAEKFPNQTFDFVFLDADHYYESVRDDILAWWTKIKQHGIVAGHDYDGMGDRRKGWGVKRAVDEFFGTIGLEVNVEHGLVWWVKKW